MSISDTILIHMNKNEYNNAIFQINTPRSINHSDFQTFSLETNIDLGIILFGFESSLPAGTHNKIKQLAIESIDSYFISQNLTNPLDTFESMLSDLNNKFFDIVKEQISWTRKINISIVLLLDNKLHFVNYGNNHLLLIKHRYMVDMIKEMSVNLQVPGKKLFDQMYSGSIENFFRFTLCNQATFDYTSFETTKDILSLLPIQNIQTQIEQLTTKTHRNQNISGVIIQKINNEVQENISEVYKSDEQPQNSIEKLIQTSQRTKKLLKPQLLPDILQIFKFLKKKEKETILKEMPEKNLPEKPIYKRFKFSKPSFNKIPFNLSNILLKVKHKKNKTIDIVKNTPQNFLYLWKNLKNKYTNLPKSSKYLLNFALILLLALAINLVTLGLKQQAKEKVEFYDSLIEQITSKHDEIQATIIYGDTKKARELLINNMNLIAKLPQNNEDRKNTYNMLFETNQKFMDEANKLYTIPSPLLLIDLNKFNNSVDPINISLNKNSIIALTNESIINININTKEISELSFTDFNIINPKYSIPIDTINLIYSEDGKIFRYDTITNSFAPTKTTFTYNNNKISDIGTYNNNLYLLDTTENQIWKMNKVGDNFSSPNKWTKEKLDISNATSFTIDGNIYILENNGNVTKLTRGNKKEFNLEKIEPPLTNTIKIYSETDIPYLYILDKNNNRIIIFDKQGKLVKQYKSDKFNNSKDFAIDYKAQEDSTLVYILAEKNIYQIAIEE